MHCSLFKVSQYLKQVRELVKQAQLLYASISKVLDKLHLPIGVIFLLILTCDRLQAQIIPDGTLGAEGSIVTPDNINGIPSDRIDGGAIRGTNLFHSFREFNVGQGQGIYFSNPHGIGNIFSRVTGSNLSQIQGRLGVLGNANLFLLNPNGIIFGPNARLDMRGSFLATTANSFMFANGFEFSATNPQAPPLLTVNIPIGLRFAANPQAILVQGTGHNHLDEQFQPTNRGNTDTGLKVQPGQTLALVGGDIALEGGTLTAEGGRIELGSVDSGVVSLLQTTEGWTLGYEGVNNFRDVNLSQKALIDVSSGFVITNSGLGFTGGGSIQVQGKNVTLTDGSLILIQNLGLQPSGNISLKASDSLQVVGMTLDSKFPSSIVNETLMGKGGDISITTQRLILQDGAQIDTRTFSPLITGVGGKIDLTATNFLQVIGFSLINPQRVSNITTTSFFLAGAGDVTILTRQLTVLNGVLIGSLSFGTGDGGDVNVTANESIELSGINPFILIPSGLGSSTLGRGNSGNLIVNTSRLSIRDGATVSASTISDGNAGSVIINASNSVEVSGKASGTNNPSFIQSSAIIQPPELRQNFRLPDVPSGNSGNVTINTNQLTIRDNNQVNVRHDGTGNAGNLMINANSIFLDNNGGITASTASGKGGNIILNVRDIIQLRNDSLISATAAGAGNGGNIDINTKFLITFPPTGPNGSDIIAKAERGNGGNIKINAQGIFGLAERPAILGDQSNDIDASSQFGASGQVQINSTINPNQGVTQLPETVVDPNALVAQNPCKKGSQSELTRTGRGGLPPNPTEDLNPQTTQVGLIEPSPTTNTQQKMPTMPNQQATRQNPIIPAQGWIFNDKGEIVLTAYNPSVTESQRQQNHPASCPTETN